MDARMRARVCSSALANSWVSLVSAESSGTCRGRRSPQLIAFAVVFLGGHGRFPDVAFGLALLLRGSRFGHLFAENHVTRTFVTSLRRTPVLGFRAHVGSSLCSVGRRITTA